MQGLFMILSMIDEDVCCGGIFSGLSIPWRSDGARLVDQIRFLRTEVGL